MKFRLDYLYRWMMEKFECSIVIVHSTMQRSVLWELERVNPELDKKMNVAYDATKAQMEQNSESMRKAAFDVAVNRVADAIRILRYVG